MKVQLKDLLLVTGSTTLFLTPTAHLFAAQNTCTNLPNSIHCVTVQAESGKFIKLKESQNGRPASSMTFCANNQTLLTITQNQAGLYKTGQPITWQFNQCIDEDCSASKLLVDDKFTITKTGKVYTTDAKKSVEVVLDPTYGQDCKMDATTKGIALQNHLLSSALDLRVNDAVAMLEAISPSLTQTTSILNNMRTIANDVATNSHTPQELMNLNNQFQTLKSAIEMAQRVNTLDGYKTISGGTVTISIGSWYSFAALNIPLPPTDIYSLNIYGQDVLSTYDAAAAVSIIDSALDVTSFAASFKNFKK